MTSLGLEVYPQRFRVTVVFPSDMVVVLNCDCTTTPKFMVFRISTMSRDVLEVSHPPIINMTL